MWRVVNFRSFLLVLLCSSFAIVALALFPQGIKTLSIAVLFVFVLVIAILCAVGKNAVKSAAFFLAAVFIVGVTINYVFTVESRERELTENAAYRFSGRIESVVGSSDKPSYIVGKLTADDTEIDGNVYLRVELDDGYSVNFLQAGDKISFTCVLEFRDGDFKNSSYYYRNDIRYMGYVAESDIAFVSSDPTFFQSLRNKIKNTLYDNLGGYAPVAYGMFVGEKNGIDDDVRDYYSASGLGHILAVSGLHVGFVTLIVSWITKKLKSGKLVDLIVNALVLAFYCFLANFSPSVVRAAIMCIMGKLALTFGTQRDTLNSLSFALSIILLIWPYSLFDVGFQMSAAAVLGIVLFARSLTRVLSHILPNVIARPLSVSVAAQIGITPVMLYHFHSFPIYSIITNLICAPLISFSFILLSVTLIFAMLIPSLGIALSFSALPLVLLDDIAGLVSKLPMSSVNVFAISTAFVLFAFYFVISPFFMLPRFKRIVSVVAAVLSLCIITVSNLPFDKSYDVFTDAAYRDVTVVLRKNDDVIIVGDVRDYSTVEELLTKARLRDVDAVYLTSVSENSAETLSRLDAKYGIGEVFVPQAVTEGSIALLASVGLDFELIYEDHESKYGITVACGDDGFAGYTYTENGITALVLGYGKTVGDVAPEIIDGVAVVRCYSFWGGYPDRVYITNYDNDFVEVEALAHLVLKRNPIALDLSSGKVRSLSEK